MLRKYYICEDVVECGWHKAYGEIYWSDENEPERCPDCGLKVTLEECDIAPNEVFMIKGAPYSKPIHSDSLGLMPSQVVEHRKRFPHIELDSQNRPVFTHVGTHQKYLDECGLVKHTQKIKPKGKVIAKINK